VSDQGRPRRPVAFALLLAHWGLLASAPVTPAPGRSARPAVSGAP